MSDDDSDDDLDDYMFLCNAKARIIIITPVTLIITLFTPFKLNITLIINFKKVKIKYNINNLML